MPKAAKILPCADRQFCVLLSDPHSAKWRGRSCSAVPRRREKTYKISLKGVRI